MERLAYQALRAGMGSVSTGAIRRSSLERAILARDMARVMKVLAAERIPGGSN